MSTARILKLTNNGEHQYFEASANGTNKITVKAPASFTTDRTIVLPSAAPVNAQFVQTDGSGNWTYAAGTATLQTAYDAAAPTITIGGGGPVILNDADGGEVLRLSATTSGNPFLSVKAATGEIQVRQTNAGVGIVGTVTAHSLELHTNNAVRVAIDTSGSVLINNNVFYQSKEAGGTARNVLGLNASDQLIVGGVPTVAILQTGSLEGLRVDASQRVAIGQTGAVTAKLHVEQSGNVVAARFFKTGTGGGNAVEIEDDGTGVALLVTKDGQATAFQVLQNSTLGIAAQIEDNGGVNLLCETTDTSVHIWSIRRGANNQDLSLKQETFVYNVTAADPQTITPAIRAGVMVEGICGRVTTAIGGADTFSLGPAGATTRYGSAIAPGLGTTWDSYTKGTTTGQPSVYDVATDLILTAANAGFNGTGQIRFTIYYKTMTAPTS